MSTAAPSDPVSILWFRSDLRLADNPALHAAASRGGAVIPVLIHAPEEEAPWAPGAASLSWLHHSLESLAANLQRAGSRLIIRRGPTAAALDKLIAETGATAIFWNRRYEPAVIARDRQIKSALRARGIVAESFNGALLWEPHELKTKSSRGPFQVFAPFWNAALEKPEPTAPLAAPQSLAAPAAGAWPQSLSVAELGLKPALQWDRGFYDVWTPGEAGAHKRLERFAQRSLHEYPDARNRPDLTGSSRLSPHLRWGEISPRQVWHAIRAAEASRTSQASKPTALAGAAHCYLREIGWREFAHHLLFHFSHTTDAPLRADFAEFPWSSDRRALRAWQRGRTGYPIVDAGMRELWHTGWMHNRVRMIVASFLTKDLLLPWQEGAKWFWDTLVDADLANNTLGWQWSGGCGADAAPYFRVFNPVSQGEKFDPQGEYVRRWVPEIARLPGAELHAPWTVSPGARSAAGIALGSTYPAPIVDHKAARERALEAYAKIRKGAPSADPQRSGPAPAGTRSTGRSASASPRAPRAAASPASAPGLFDTEPEQ